MSLQVCLSNWNLFSLRPPKKLVLSCRPFCFCFIPLAGLLKDYWIYRSRRKTWNLAKVKINLIFKVIRYRFVIYSLLEACTLYESQTLADFWNLRLPFYFYNIIFYLHFIRLTYIIHCFTYVIFNREDIILTLFLTEKT